MELTQARLKELLHYDPETGIFTWLVAKGRCPKGKKAGVVKENGYISIGVDGKYYYAHRLAYLYMTGDWPPVLVDHANRDPSDNSWPNLRPATCTQNHANKIGYGSTGFKGVRPDKKKWMARIGINGRTRYIGVFATPEEANSAFAREAENCTASLLAQTSSW